MLVYYQKFYDDYINKIETEKVILFGEEKEFYKTSDGKIFGNKSFAISNQSRIIDKKYKDNALDKLLYSRRVEFDAETLSNITSCINVITKKGHTMIRYEYDDAIKVYSYNDYLDIMNKINTVLRNASCGEFYISPLYKFPEDKSYDIVFLSKASYKMEFLSVIDDMLKTYKTNYSNIYHYLYLLLADDIHEDEL